MRTFIDQMNREVWVPEMPQRIISLVPSQTEFLYDLGLTDEVVGQTLFCIHPEEMHRSKPRVGGTKKLKMDVIDSLKPDLIIGNKEENDQEQIELLMQKYPVWMSDIKTVADAYEMMKQLGLLVNRAEQAQQIISEIQVEVSKIKIVNARSAIYMIWREPWMAAGNDTFISEILKLFGVENLVQGRYPELSPEYIQQLQPDMVLLSSEPYPFKEKHIQELQNILPQADIKLVDGELCSWYGSRMRYMGRLEI